MASTVAKSSCTSASGPVQFHDQHGVGRREVGVDSGFRRPQRQRVHHLHGGRHDPGPDDLRHRGARGVQRVVGGQKRLHGLRLAQDAHDDLGHHGQRAFAADDERQEIGPRRVGPRAADAHHLAVGQHGFHLDHVVHREAVLEAVRAAGVLGHVAADRTHLLAGGIGGVVVAVWRDLPGDLEVGDAGFHRDLPIRQVHVQHAVHAGQADDHAARNRQRATRQPRAVAPRHERHFLAGAGADHGLHVGGRGRQHDDRGCLAQMRQRVALVGHQLHRLAQHAVRAADGHELVEEPVGQRLQTSADGTLSDRAHALGLRHERARGGPARRGRNRHRAGVQAARARCAWHPAEGHPPPPGQLPAFGAGQARTARRHFGLRYHARPAPAGVPESHLRGAAAHAALGRDDPHRDGYPSREHRGRAGKDAGPRHPEHLPRDQPRQPRQRLAGARRAHEHRRGGVPQPRMDGGRRPHHHGIRGAALLRRLQRRDPRWWPRAWPGSAPSSRCTTPSASAARRPRGASPKATRFTTTCGPWPRWRRRTSRSTSR